VAAAVALGKLKAAKQSPIYLYKHQYGAMIYQR
jgi:hypothetical protein